MPANTLCSNGHTGWGWCNLPYGHDGDHATKRAGLGTWTWSYPADLRCNRETRYYDKATGGSDWSTCERPHGHEGFCSAQIEAREGELFAPWVFPESPIEPKPSIMTEWTRSDFSRARHDERADPTAE